MRNEQTPSHRASLWLTKFQLAALSALITSFAYFTELRIIGPELDTWTRDLQQPFFAPPAFLIAPILFVLSMTMAIAYFRILLYPTTQTEKLVTSLRFLGQLALGVLWCYLVFVLKSLAAGILFGLQFAFLALETGRTFYVIDRKSGFLMIPQIIWSVYGFLYSAALLFMNIKASS